MDDDWRLRGQEDYLDGAVLTLKPFRPRPNWDHDHCEFCWAKFMNAAFSPESVQFIKEHPEILAEGYAAPRGDEPDYWWICPACATDFAKRFNWTLVG